MQFRILYLFTFALSGFIPAHDRRITDHRLRPFVNRAPGPLLLNEARPGR